MAPRPIRPQRHDRRWLIHTTVLSVLAVDTGGFVRRVEAQGERSEVLYSDSELVQEARQEFALALRIG